MEAATDHITAEEYFELSREGDRTQLIDGVLVVNQPRFLHGVVHARILGALVGWTDGAPGRGMAATPIDVTMSEHDVYGPDVVWYREERVPADWEAEHQAMPDLVVEVRSPGTWRFDTGRKREMYERGGMPELWLVDTREEAVIVHRRSQPQAAEFDIALELGGSEVLRSPLLPGFALELKDLFRRA